MTRGEYLDTLAGVPTVGALAAALAAAQGTLDDAEHAYGEANHAAVMAGRDLTQAKEARDALRLELREAVRAAGLGFGDRP